MFGLPEKFVIEHDGGSRRVAVRSPVARGHAFESWLPKMSGLEPCREAFRPGVAAEKAEVERVDECLVVIAHVRLHSLGEFAED